MITNCFFCFQPRILIRHISGLFILRQYWWLSRYQAERITEFKKFNQYSNYWSSNKLKEEKTEFISFQMSIKQKLFTAKEAARWCLFRITAEGDRFKRKTPKINEKWNWDCKQEIERVIAAEAKKAGKKSSKDSGFATNYSGRRFYPETFSGNQGKITLACSTWFNYRSFWWTSSCHFENM